MPVGEPLPPIPPAFFFPMKKGWPPLPHQTHPSLEEGYVKVGWPDDQDEEEQYDVDARMAGMVDRCCETIKRQWSDLYSEIIGDAHYYIEEGRMSCEELREELEEYSIGLHSQYSQEEKSLLREAARKCIADWDVCDSERLGPGNADWDQPADQQREPEGGGMMHASEDAMSVGWDAVVKADPPDDEYTDEQFASLPHDHVEFDECLADIDGVCTRVATTRNKWNTPLCQECSDEIDRKPPVDFRLYDPGPSKCEKCGKVSRDVLECWGCNADICIDCDPDSMRSDFDGHTYCTDCGPDHHEREGEKWGSYPSDLPDPRYANPDDFEVDPDDIGYRIVVDGKTVMRFSSDEEERAFETWRRMAASSIGLENEGKVASDIQLYEHGSKIGSSLDLTFFPDMVDDTTQSAGLVEGFTEEWRDKLTSLDPMEIGWGAVVKASMYFGENDPKGGQQAGREGLAWAVTPEYQRALKDADIAGKRLRTGANVQELGTRMWPADWNPMSAWGEQQDPSQESFRGINLSAYGQRLRAGQLGEDEDEQEQGLIEHMGETAMHEATHEAQAQPIGESWFDESAKRMKGGGDMVSEQERASWDEYGAIAAQVGSQPNPRFYPGLTGREATQEMARRHNAYVPPTQGQNEIRAAFADPFDFVWDFSITKRIRPIGDVFKAFPERMVDVVSRNHPRRYETSKEGEQIAHPALSPQTLAGKRERRSGSVFPAREAQVVIPHDEDFGSDPSGEGSLEESITDYQRQQAQEGKSPQRSLWDRIKQIPERMKMNREYRGAATIMSDVQWAQGGPRSQYHSRTEPLNWGSIHYDREGQQRMIDQLNDIQDAGRDLDWGPANQQNQQALSEWQQEKIQPRDMG